MSPFVSPPIAAWRSRPGHEFRFAEVWLQRSGGGFQLRHVADCAVPGNELRELAPGDLQAWAQTTQAGAFRPNKAAPGLRRGWRTEAVSASDLETAFDGLYPGAVADWFAVEQGAAVITSFREFTGRQTGMYRCTAQLSDVQAAAVIRAGCAPQVCLRRRLWTVDGLLPDAPTGKSEIPCLEPCALLLEFARRATRLEQDERVPLNLGTGELATLRAAVDLALAQPDPTVREGDTSAPANPRRLLLLREKLSSVLQSAEPVKEV